MNLTERMAHTQQLIDENPTALAVTIPVHILEILLAHCKESLENKARANYYKDLYLLRKKGWKRHGS